MFVNFFKNLVLGALVDWPENERFHAVCATSLELHLNFIENILNVFRKPQYKDVYRRTIEIRVHYEPLNSN